MTTNPAHDPVGDPEALRRLERFGGLKLRDELTTLFLVEAPSRIEKARAALDDGDMDGVRAVAHMLKSSAGQMGALQVQRVCERLESIDAQDASRTLVDLDAELARYRTWLQTVFPPPAAT